MSKKIGPTLYRVARRKTVCGHTLGRIILATIHTDHHDNIHMGPHYTILCAHENKSTKGFSSLSGLGGLAQARTSRHKAAAAAPGSGDDRTC